MVLLLSATVMPARAARPLLDSGKWDNYFALFARDTQVPWQPITVRLDTYSGAGVDFAAYAVDPAEVRSQLDPTSHVGDAPIRARRLAQRIRTTVGK